jgi:hypothetical protein
VISAVLATVSWAAGTAVGFAGDGNVLYLKQDSSAYVTGESFQSDQSNSINSSIGSLETPALQLGSKDSATLTIDSSCSAVSDSCGHADLTQDSDYVAALADHPEAPDWLGGVLAGASFLAGGNSAQVTVTGQGSAAVSQYGFGNHATVVADDGAGSINQIGLGNTAKLTVTPLLPGGGVGSVAVNQIGLGNSVNVVASTPAGTSSSYTQMGVGLSYGTAQVAIASTVAVDVKQTGFVIP